MEKIFDSWQFDVIVIFCSVVNTFLQLHSEQPSFFWIILSGWVGGYTLCQLIYGVK